MMFRVLSVILIVALGIGYSTACVSDWDYIFGLYVYGVRDNI